MLEKFLKQLLLIDCRMNGRPTIILLPVFKIPIILILVLFAYEQLRHSSRRLQSIRQLYAQVVFKVD